MTELKDYKYLTEQLKKARDKIKLLEAYIEGMKDMGYRLGGNFRQ